MGATGNAVAESAKREVTYALGNDRRTLLWLANQRAVEFHPGLSTIDQPDYPTHLVLDIDPPEESFGLAVEAALLVRQALADVGMLGAVKTSGAKGLHVFVPITGAMSEEVAAATRALAARAEQLDPGADHRVRESRPRREGVPRLNAGRRRHSCRGLQSTPPGRPARVVSSELGRPRQRFAGRLHHPHRVEVVIVRFVR